jgi:hypothetical protein
MGSGYKVFTSGAVLTASDLNNYCQEQTVMYFANTTARDTAITAPEDGMVAYVGSNDANEGLYTYNGSGWRKGPGWNAPWGVVSITTLASTVSYTATSWGFPAFQWDGTGVIANRRYKATVDFAWGLAASVGQIDFGIGTAAGTGIGRQISEYQYANTAPRQNSHSVTFATTAGTMTRGLTIRKLTGGGSVDVIAGSTLVIEDIGPAGAPA